ncbi:hypothetical protein [Bifidobacterium cuniculi]|uniref:hypothetical protein n=1 Tax=Bifidobacterium cuniculi TaxID=1688 RepID=UPI000AA10A6F|nr:hypothetical protein [Bifidobacterium cuniculi]
MDVHEAHATRPILRSKVFLYVTEFFSGMAVMAAELGAQRLLAPYFSSSQIVWAIIIGTIMIALALGAVFGGKWADRDPDPDRLYRRILVVAVRIALVPLVGKYLVILVADVPGTTNRELFARKAGPGIPSMAQALERMEGGGTLLDRTVRQVAPGLPDRAGQRPQHRPHG